MLYFKYVRMVIRSHFQYRLSMCLNVIGQFFVSFFAFAGMWLLFERFGSIGGWTFGEAALCYAVAQTAFAVTECFARGFDLFQNFIRTGSFDRIMLRPQSVILQVLGSNFEISRIGRLAQSLTVLVIAISRLDTDWNVLKGFTLAFMVFSGVFIFTGIFMLGATVCFWTVEGLEVVNIFTDGGREIAQYPLTIYNKWLMRFFTFIIPFGSFNYLPLLYLTDRADGSGWLYMLTPLLGVVFLAPCVLVWHAGVRHYQSTGS